MAFHVHCILVIQIVKKCSLEWTKCWLTRWQPHLLQWKHCAWKFSPSALHPSWLVSMLTRQRAHGPIGSALLDAELWLEFIESVSSWASRNSWAANYSLDFVLSNGTSDKPARSPLSRFSAFVNSCSGFTFTIGTRIPESDIWTQKFELLRAAIS